MWIICRFFKNLPLQRMGGGEGDPEFSKFQCYLGPSPRDWRTLIHFNVVPTVFHIDHKSQGMCQTVRTTFQCIVVLQLRVEGPENLSRICPIVMCLFRKVEMLFLPCGFPQSIRRYL